MQYLTGMNWVILTFILEAFSSKDRAHAEVVYNHRISHISVSTKICRNSAI
jgi:hypothetical protein